MIFFNNEGGGLKTQNISNGKINLGCDREGMEIEYCVFCLTKDGWKHHVGWPKKREEEGRQLRKKEEEERIGRKRKKRVERLYDSGVL